MKGLKESCIGFLGLLVVFAALIEYKYASRKEYTETGLDIFQNVIVAPGQEGRRLRQFVENANGQIAAQGWGTGNESAFSLRSGDATPWAYRLEKLNMFKERNWSVYFIYTPTHVIFTQKARIGPLCFNFIQVFEKGKNPQKSLWKIEDTSCPEFADEMRDYLGPGLRVEGKQVKMKVDQSLVNNNYQEVKFDSKQDKTLKMALQFDNFRSKTFTWVMPMSDDRTTYLITVKKAALPLKGNYKFQGKTYECDEEKKDCLLSFDVGRGYHNYGVAYYWAFFQTLLPDGTLMSLNLGDGIGSDFHSADKASEDHITINGTVFKLDVSEMEYDKNDYMSQKVLKTKENQGFSKKRFPERKCEVIFKPIGQITEGVNAVLIAFKQYLVFGLFEGYCQLENNQVFKFSRVFGHVEHVYSRW